MNSIQREICENLWNEYEPQLRKICRVKLRSCPDEVDDVMSEVSLALCKQIEKFGKPEKPKQWLYATFNNIINLKYREIYKQKEKQENIENKDFELPFEQNGMLKQTIRIIQFRGLSRMKKQHMRHQKTLSALKMQKPHSMPLSVR